MVVESDPAQRRSIQGPAIQCPRGRPGRAHHQLRDGGSVGGANFESAQSGRLALPHCAAHQWKAQTPPVIMNGLPSCRKAAIEYFDTEDWGAFPQSPLETIQAHSRRAHTRRGDYNVPTFFVHGTADDLVPW
ncbi:hypothetical protein GGS26DRAFT_234488 [Hypomontagnella submonticulosa]|nr:hypothetical protein GGS26DRAFT_234488 [Hypomontagnella submonticulosa]